ncbi:unnamed protein product [Thlaspi arvense]|uniref:Defensin-like protein n=1 Tax=Thlaspi arvense TaxID=13288 RepID=A0AAU9RLI3_THLAR|nr:unnamed protein product [Thlaspi arvense]
MSKSIFFALFIILIIGSIANEVQGQGKLCGKDISVTDCGGGGGCNALCLQLYKGTGKCIEAGQGRFRCGCYYPC